MPTPQQIQDALSQVRNQQTFLDCLLKETLGWPIPDGIEQTEEIAFEWPLADLNAEGLTKHLVAGHIYQIKLTDDQPWGIFLLEFANDEVFHSSRGMTSPLRKVLRGLVPKCRGGKSNLPSWNRENLLFICTNRSYQHFRFAYFKAPKENIGAESLSTFGWGPNIPNRTACEFNLPRLVWPENADDSQAWLGKWREAFDKQKLTKLFFDEYKAIFDIFQNDLVSQSRNAVWAHDYALQFLNRCMFLYFIQRKSWLGQDSDFMKSFWMAYQQSGQPKDTFFEKWLKVLFFEAFNNNYSRTHKHFPAAIDRALTQAPYLNGGLFRQNDLDNPAFNFMVTDNRFRQILDFLDRYNFTVSEDTPLDIEVAVDAEMLGMVYETLVNIAEDEDRRGDAGIFYTPRIEVDMMCRLSIVNFLCNQLGYEHREIFYKWLFAFTGEKKRIAEQAIREKKMLEPLRQSMQNLSVLDPTCGSGAFLVGMLLVLDGLFEHLDAMQKTPRSVYQRRKDIIGSTLYGVDIKDWACHVAELRLWLALIIEADFSAAELHDRKEPLLPNFTFNIRCGDSLIQEIGGLDMAHRKGALGLSDQMKRKLRELKKQKSLFYANSAEAEYKTAEQLQRFEIYVFGQLLEDRIAQLDKDLKNLMRIQAEKKSGGAQQRNFLTGELETPTKQFTLEYEQREQQIAALSDDKQRLETVSRTLHSDKAAIPFIWDISFAEVFADDKQGFDVVIGNPPYVRQEKIANPRLKPAQITTENKKAYKDKLQHLMYRTWDKWFGYKEGIGKAARALDAKSDLYIYFYFYGLSLLNDKGTFCFITSNSWLDVGYGADLQEFLLNCCPVRMIIDNKAMRSFKSADVNTAIALLNAPSPKPADRALLSTMRFVMFYVPFEQVANDITFTLIDSLDHTTRTDQFRVFPMLQQTLLDNASQIEEEIKERKNKAPLVKTSKKYLGDKWGGKYLRAPDIYWTILEKGKDKLVRLGDIAEVRFGIKTGANEFFYLDQEAQAEWKIPDEYLQPIIFSLKEIKTIEDNLENLKYRIFTCGTEKDKIKNKHVLDYINWGEKNKYHKRPSCASRKIWYSIAENWKSCPFIFPAKVGERMLVLRNTPGYFEDKKLYGITPYAGTKDYWSSALNSTLSRFFMDLLCRQLTGAQAIADIDVQVVNDILLVRQDVIDINNLSANYKKIAKRPMCSHVKEEYLQEDRKELDNLFFDAIKLTKAEKQAVYEAVIDLVEARLEKADSLKDSVKINKRLAAVDSTIGIWDIIPDNETEEE